MEREQTQANSWPSFRAPPRELERARELIELASDGHGEFGWVILFFILGFAAGVAVSTALELNPLVSFVGVLLGVACGRQLSRTLLARVLRDGAEVRGQVVKLIVDSQKVAVRPDRGGRARSWRPGAGAVRP